MSETEMAGEDLAGERLRQRGGDFMDVVDLPILDIEATLQSALAAMRKAQRAGVVARGHKEVWLFTAPEIFYGLAHKKRQLIDIARPGVLHLLTESDAVTARLDMKDPRQTHREYDSFLDIVGKSYVVVRFAGNTATVVTRHEGFAEPLKAGPKDCYCLGTPSHAYPPPNVHTGDTCLFDTSQVHCEE